MLINVTGAKCIGIDAVPVTVEVDVILGIGIHLVGLADTAVKESLLRTITALQALGYRIPGRKIVINLAPADLHKSGSGYDLPIALGIIAASGQRSFPDLGSYLVMGELGLDGAVRDIAGALPIVDMARSRGMKACILPLHSALEAAEFTDISIYGVETLADCVRILSGEECEGLLVRNTRTWRKMQRARHHAMPAAGVMDFEDIIGQEGAKRGAEIAAAGGHNLIKIGMDFPPKRIPPGLLYKRIFSSVFAPGKGILSHFPCLFCILRYIYKEKNDMNTISTPQKQYKRQDRSVSPETRQKISQTLKGKSESITHRTHISQGVANYWRQIPPKKETEQDGTTIEDIML